MTYDAKEESTADAAPFECYKFVTPLGTFRYTSLPENVTVGGEVYTPGTIARGSVEISTIIDSAKTMDVKIPMTYAIAKAYTGSIVPEFFTVTILRAHLGDDLSTQVNVEWYGEATGYGYDPGVLVVRTRSALQAKVNGGTTSVYCQLTCNHKVYDGRCGAAGLNEADFTETTIVTKVDDISITVQVMAHATSEMQLGRMVNQRTGEERTIYQVVGKVVTVTYPFLDIIVGDTVDLILGCDNRFATCISRFNNVSQFGGHKYVPLSNPFADN